MVWRLVKALYGLRRSPLLWQRHLKKLLSKLRLTPLGDEPDILISDKIILAIYVDDILIIYPRQHSSAASDALALLKANFKLREIGEPQQFLSLQIYRNRDTRTISINQSAYLEKIATKFLSPEQMKQARESPFQFRAVFSKTRGKQVQAQYANISKKLAPFFMLPSTPDQRWHSLFLDSAELMSIRLQTMTELQIPSFFICIKPGSWGLRSGVQQQQQNSALHARATRYSVIMQKIERAAKVLS